MNYPYRSMSSLMLLRESTPEVWAPDDLAAMLSHQLEAPLIFVLAPDMDDGTAGQQPRSSAPRPASFADLFSDPNPPLDLLKLTKQFAKEAMENPDRGLPRDVAFAIYYLAIGMAAQRLGERISSLSDVEMLQGLRWCLDQDWLRAPVRGWVRACCASYR